MPSDLIIAGGRVVGPYGVTPADVMVGGGRIRAVGAGLRRPDPIEVLDASDLLVAPGYIDTQINGAAGVDLTREPERVGDVALALPRYGVTSFLPTVTSAPSGVADRLLDAVTGHRRGGGEAEPLGAHFEGPMLNPARRGAHPAARLRRPSLDLVEGWSRARGLAMVTIAPELPNALEVIGRLAERGVVVAAGHTDAATDVLLRSLDAGVTHLTHLFNAMRPLHHRDPGPVGVALGHAWLTAGLIADGVHLHPLTVAAAWSAMGRRINLVTDALAVLGTQDADGEVPRTAEGILAGSNLSLDQAVRNLVAWTRCPVADAIATVTSTPAGLLGRPHKGRIAEGADADLVLLDRGLRVVATVVGGSLAYWTR